MNTLQEFRFDFNSFILFWINPHCKTDNPEIRLANFAVAVKNIYRLIGSNSEDIFIVFELQGNFIKEITIPISQFSNLYSHIKRIYPEYILYPDSHKSKELFNQYVSEIYSTCNCRDNLPIFYATSGWHNNGCYWHYYSGNEPGCLGSLHLPQELYYSVPELIQWTMNLFQLSNIEITLPLIIYAHLGYTLKLFEDAGYNENPPLIIVGESGCKKTSLARVLFCLFGGSLINFTATNRAMELEMMQRQDSVMVLDDLTSGVNKFQTLAFERILRQVGDSTGRKKSVNGGTELDAVKTRSAIVVTAESDIDSLQKSSKLRTLLVRVFKNSINSSVLSQYQQDELEAHYQNKFSKLEQYMSSYIKFLEYNYHSIVQDLINIKVSFNNDFNFARQDTLFKILVSQSKIILDFWASYSVFSPTEINYLYQNFTEVLYNIIKTNEQRSISIEPYIMFLFAIMHALQLRQIITFDKLSFAQNIYGCYIGYTDGDLLFLDPIQAHKYVVQYYRNQDIFFTENKQMLHDKLYEMNLLDVYEQNNHKAKLLKKVKINGVSTPFLCLNLLKVEQILNHVDYPF